MWLQGLPGYQCCYYSLQLLSHLLKVIPYILLVRSFPYRSDLRNLDIIYAAFCPAFIYKVLLKYIALGEYLYWYRVPTSLVVGILGKGQVAVSNILLINRVNPYGQCFIVSPNFSNKERQFQSILQLDKLSLLNVQLNIKVGHLFPAKDYIIGPQVQNTKGDTKLAPSINSNIQF